MNWPNDVTPAPRILVLPEAADNLDEADAAIELWEHYTGKVLDPAQRLTVSVMMAQRSDGVWAAQTTGREMPRQNGKGDELEVVELWGLVQRAEAILHTIHDAVLLATQTQERMLGVLESHPDLRKLIKRRWKGTGQQMIEMRNGGVIWYRTRTGSGGRGVDDIDRLVIDEAQHATAEQLAAMTPTLLANKNPQMNIVGTAGLEGRSEWWWEIRKRALSADPGAFGYVGHTAETVTVTDDGRVDSDAPDVEDRSVWWDANPALHAGRGQGVAFLEEQYRNLGAGMFAQEHLCVWAPPPHGPGDGPITLEQWRTLIDATKTIETDAARLSFDTTPARDFSTFGVAGWRDDGLGFVGVQDTRPGTQWVVGRAVELFEGTGQQPIVIVRGSPGASFINDFESAGVTVDVMTPAEYAEACGRFIDAVNNNVIRHHDHPRHFGALKAAKTKDAGDGLLVWSRRSSTADITPLTTAAAAWGRVNDRVDAGYAWNFY